MFTTTRISVFLVLLAITTYFNSSVCNAASFPEQFARALSNKVETPVGNAGVGRQDSDNPKSGNSGRENVGRQDGVILSSASSSSKNSNSSNNSSNNSNNNSNNGSSASISNNISADSLGFSGGDKIKVVFRINDYQARNSALYTKVLEIFKRYRVPVTVGVLPYNLQMALGGPQNAGQAAGQSADKNAGQVSKQAAGQSADKNAGQDPKQAAGQDLVQASAQVTAQASAQALAADIMFLKDLADSGWVEIAQNGYKHVINYSNDHFKSEFYGRSYEEQNREIAEGRKIVQQITGHTPTTFIPPWDSFDHHTTQVLSALGYNCVAPSRYGFFNTNNPTLAYIPHTTYPQYLQETLEKIRFDQVNGKEFTQAELTAVVIIHDYDFTESGKKPVENDRETLTLQQFELLIQQTVTNQDLQLATVAQLAKQKELYSNEKYRQSSQPDYLLPLPSILPPHSLRGYYEDLPTYKRIRNLYFEFGYYTLISILGMFIAYQVNKRTPCVVKRVITTISLLVTFASLVMLMRHTDSNKIIFTLVVSFWYNLTFITICYVKKKRIFEECEPRPKHK